MVLYEMNHFGDLLFCAYDVSNILFYDYPPLSYVINYRKRQKDSMNFYLNVPPSRPITSYGFYFISILMCSNVNLP